MIHLKINACDVPQGASLIFQNFVWVEREWRPFEPDKQATMAKANLWLTAGYLELFLFNHTYINRN